MLTSLYVSQALDLMEKKKLDHLLIVADDGGLVGIVTMQSLSGKLIRNGCTLDSNVSQAFSPEYPTVPHNLILGRVSRIVERSLFALVKQTPPTKDLLVVTRSDFLAFITGPQS